MTKSLCRTEPLRILGVVEGWIPTVKIALEQPLSYLEAQGDIKLDIKLAIELDMLDIASHDLIIFQRCIYPYSIEALQYAQQLRKATLYDIDDNFFAFSPDTRLGALFNKPENRNTVCTHMLGCDRVKVGSPELKKEVEQLFAEHELPPEAAQEHIILHPFCVNLALLEGVERRLHPGEIVIGYAGTINHGPDFEPLIPALKRILDEYPQVRLEMAGLMLPEFEKHPRARMIEFNNDYDAFFRGLGAWGWDIGLAPLRDTLPNRSKTNNKYREYAACRIAGVYSALPVYADSVRDRETGLVVAHTEEDWYQALKRLVEDEGLRTHISDAARRDVEEHYDVPVIAELWKREILSQLDFEPLYSRDSLWAFYAAAQKTPIQFYGRQTQFRQRFIPRVKAIIKRIMKALHIWPKNRG